MPWYHISLQLRGYSIRRQAGIEPSSQGYATFCNSNYGASDYVVVEHEQLYRDNLVATGISLGTLALFASLAAPILIYQQYGKIYTYAKEKSGNFLYLIWSIVTLCTVADYLLSFLALFYHIQCWSRPHYDSIYKNLYVGALGVWVAVGILDLPIAVLVVLKSKKKDFPVPDLVRYIMCHFHSCPWVGREITNTYIIQILAVWHTLAALQILCFHAVFVFVAFIAQPLHTGLTMIFYAATVFCLTTTIMLLYASFHVGHYVSLKQGKMREFFTNLGFGVLQTLIFIFFLFTIIFFGFTFLRIIVFVGDTESSRISGLVGSVLPSVLIAIFGFMAKKLLDNYTDKNQKNGGDDHAAGQIDSNPVGHINNFDGVDNTVIMLNPANDTLQVKVNTL